MGRTIFIGDIHGCAAELELLLDQLEFAPADRLVSVGDTVARGPQSGAVLSTLRRLGARGVAGNHELRLLAAHSAVAEGRRLPKLEASHRQLLESLTDEDWAHLARLPLTLELPEHGVRVVHAGVVPGRPIEAHDARLLTHMRTLLEDGSPSERLNGRLWGELYQGEPHVVFGHNAISGLQLHPCATGLDSACVYGGRLTALVLEEGAPVPATAQERSRRLCSVGALESYFSIPSTKRA